MPIVIINRIDWENAKMNGTKLVITLTELRYNTYLHDQILNDQISSLRIGHLRQYVFILGVDTIYRSHCFGTQV